MRTILPALGLGLILALPAAGQDKPQEKALEGDLAKVQGKWAAKVGPQKDIPVVMEIKGNASVIRLTAPDGQEFEIKGTFKLDETASPEAWLNSKRTTNSGQELPESEAIYKIEGDTLTYCRSQPGGTRPTEFKDGEDGQLLLMIFTRQKD